MNFAVDGAKHLPAALRSSELAALASLAERTLAAGPGARLTGEPELLALLAPDATLHRLAVAHLGGARPVRAVLFDKRPDQNWSVGWHQDRTIVVRERIEVEGFANWSAKVGLLHVEPPEHVLAGMLTLRAHLDDCDAKNAPLLVSPGTHKFGRVPEAKIKEMIARHGISTCLARAGDVWVYSTPILHASASASRPARRRVLQIDFAVGELPGGLAWRGVG